MIAQVLKSKTVLFALTLELLGVVQLNADFLSTVLTPAQFGWVMLGIGVVVKVLRAVTIQPLSDK
jgi:hypothetical protein